MENLICIEELKPEDIKYEEIIVGNRRRRRRKIHLSVPYSDPPERPRTKIVIDVERVENLTEDVDIQTDQIREPRCTITNYVLIVTIAVLIFLVCGILMMVSVTISNAVMLSEALTKKN